MIQDLRDALRRLTADRTFSAVALLTLGLGLGANIAIFSLISSIVLRPLPYAHADRLVMIANPRSADTATWLSAQEIASYRRAAAALEEVAAMDEAEVNLTGGGEPERIRAAAVTPNLFDTLGASPRLGRTFVPAEGRPGADGVVLLGYGLWQRRFGGVANIVGTSILMNGTPRTVVGVMPASFRLPVDYLTDRQTEAWIPLVIDPANLGQWGDRGLTAVALLRRGASANEATSELAVVADRWIRDGYVADQGDFALYRSAVPLHDFVTGRVRFPLLVLLGTVGFVLLIAVANVANLLLARAGTRSLDVAIRAALGAPRRRLVGQMLMESALVGIAGSAVGMAIAHAGIRAVASLESGALPRFEEVTLDAGTFAFAAVLGTLAGMLFGLAPAVQFSRPDLAGMLHEGGRTGTAGRGRQLFRRGLVVGQLALSLVLVLGAVLLARSLMALGRIELGFDPVRVLTAQLQLPFREYQEPDAVVRFYERLGERLEQIPGVAAAGAARILPLTRTIGDWSITLEGRPFSPVENPNGDFQAVTPGYFRAMRLRLLRGRLLEPSDRSDAPLVVVVNETMARRYWPGDEAIGKRFRMGTGDTPWMSIVGVVDDVRHNAVLEEARAEMYLPHAQLPRTVGGATRAMGLVVRADAEPLALIGAVRAAVRDLDPNLPLSDIQTMDAIAARALADRRFTTVLLGSFATLALLIAAIGIYGTISLVVSERAREIGIRMALGAQRTAILRMIILEGLALVLLGSTVGLAAAASLTRLLDRLMYGVSRFDPLTFATVPLLLVAVALLASLLPALRAARLDPAELTKTAR